MPQDSPIMAQDKSKFDPSSLFLNNLSCVQPFSFSNSTRMRWPTHSRMALANACRVLDVLVPCAAFHHRRGRGRHAGGCGLSGIVCLHFSLSRHATQQTLRQDLSHHLHWTCKKRQHHACNICYAHVTFSVSISVPCHARDTGPAECAERLNK